MSLHRWAHTLVAQPAQGIESDDTSLHQTNVMFNTSDIHVFGGNGRDVHPIRSAQHSDFTPVVGIDHLSHESEKLELNSIGSGDEGAWLKKKDFNRLKKEQKLLKQRQKLIDSQIKPAPQSDDVMKAEQGASKLTVVNGRLSSIATANVDIDSWLSASGLRSVCDKPQWCTMSGSTWGPSSTEHSSSVELQNVALPGYVDHYLHQVHLRLQTESAFSGALTCVLGGRSSPHKPQSTVWLLHTQTNTWMRLVKVQCGNNNDDLFGLLLYGDNSLMNTATDEANTSSTDAVLMFCTELSCLAVTVGAHGDSLEVQRVLAGPALGSSLSVLSHSHTHAEPLWFQSRFRHVCVNWGASVLIHGGRGVLHSDSVVDTAVSMGESTPVVYNDTWVLSLSQWPPSLRCVSAGTDLLMTPESDTHALQPRNNSTACLNVSQPPVVPAARYGHSGVMGFWEMDWVETNSCPLDDSHATNGISVNQYFPVYSGFSSSDIAPFLVIQGGLLSLFMCDPVPDPYVYILPLCPSSSSTSLRQYQWRRLCFNWDDSYRRAYGYSSWSDELPMSDKDSNEHVVNSVPTVLYSHRIQALPHVDVTALHAVLDASSHTTVSDRGYSYAPREVSNPANLSGLTTRTLFFVGGSSPHERAFNQLVCLQTNGRPRWGNVNVNVPTHSPTQKHINASAATTLIPSAAPHLWQCSAQYKWQSPLFHPDIGLALWLRHDTAVLQQDVLMTSQHDRVMMTSCHSDILVSGGGSLCFSFGTYHSPSFLLRVRLDSSDVSVVDVYRLSRGEGSSTVNTHTHWTVMTLGNTINNLNDIVIESNPSKRSKTTVQTQANPVALDLTSAIVAPVINLVTQDHNKATVTQHRCSVCNESFSSKNQLYKHLQKWGHRK